MLKGVIFDLDDTLYSYKKMNEGAITALEEYACNKLEINREKFREAFQYGRNETKRGIEKQASAHNRIIYMQKTLEYLQQNPFRYALEMYNVYWDYFMNNMTLIKGSIEVLDLLQQNAIKIGVCTDLTSHIQQRKIRALGLDKYISYIVSSEEVGVEKPDPRMFLEILKKMNLKASETIYIGDNFRRDILGASAVGMTAYWYNPEHLMSEQTDFAFKQFVSYQELKGLIVNEVEKY